MSHVISAWRLLKAGVGVEQHRITNSTPSKTSHVIPAKTISSGLRPASQSDLKWPGLSPTLPWTSQHPVRPHRQIGCTCHDISRSPKSRIRRRLTRTVNALLTIFGDFLDAAPPAVFLTRVGRLARPASTAPRVQWHQNRTRPGQCPPARSLAPTVPDEMCTGSPILARTSIHLSPRNLVTSSQSACSVKKDGGPETCPAPAPASVLAGTTNAHMHA